jgi:5,10-methenyltetrahydromethanopterin hydrogenase
MQLQKVLSGRPTKYDPQIVSKIIREVREGASFTQACVSAGINFVTFMEMESFPTQI